MPIKAIAEFVARLRGWQVFLLLIVPLFAGQFFLSAQMRDAADPGSPDPVLFAQLVRQVLAMSLIMLVLTLMWFLSVTWVANRRIDASLRPSLRLATSSAVYVVAYALLATAVWPSAVMSDGLPGYIVPLHVLAVAGIFYVIAFAARNVVMAERRRKVTFGDYAGSFFLMWFFPVGVWFVQPRVNRLAGSG